METLWIIWSAVALLLLMCAVRTHHVSLVGDSDAPAARAVEPAVCALVVAS